MNVPCSVIEDLLPLYAEGLTSEETNKLVEEHIETCESCKSKLEDLKSPREKEPESKEPIENLKKEINKRRGRVAVIAALAVFIVLFTVIVHITERKPVDYNPNLIRVEGVYPYGWTELWKPENATGVVVVKSEGAGSLEIEYVCDPDTGEITAYLQCWEDGLHTRSDEETYLLNDQTKRVYYGYGPDQTLLWGEPMNGGVQILPRLALTFYVVVAAVLAAIFAVLWLVFKKRKAGNVFRILCFIPLSYLIGHLLVKGFSSISYFMIRDLGAILIAGFAVYVLISVIYHTVKR